MSMNKCYKCCYYGSIIAEAHLDNTTLRTYIQSSTTGLHEQAYHSLSKVM